MEKQLHIWQYIRKILKKYVQINNAFTTQGKTFISTRKTQSWEIYQNMINFYLDSKKVHIM